MKEILKQCPDEYIWSKSRKVLTWEQIHIDGLEMFGHVHSRYKVERLSYHSHPTIEFVYIVSGSQNYYIDGKEYIVKGNQVFLAPPNCEHGTENSLHGRYEFFWFRLAKLPHCRFLNLDKETGDLLWNKLLSLPSNLIVPEHNLKDLITDCFNKLSINNELSRIEGCALLIQFLCEITSNAVSEKISEPIAAAVAYIDANIFDSIALEKLAQISILSVSRFKFRFREEMQITPREYINLKKIEKSKELLLSTNMSVTKIAMKLSFSSSNYFTTLFHQITGITPTQFRKNCL